jgi:hypothetical protein
MADHPDTWARIVEMARVRFPGNEPAGQAFAQFTYDTEEMAAYAAAQDADDDEQFVLDAARRAAQLRAELYSELRDEASASATACASAATGWSARAVARAVDAEVLHTNGPPGWTTNAEVLYKVDDDESDDFADFDDEEDTPDVTEEQRTIVALFKTAHRDRAA